MHFLCKMKLVHTASGSGNGAVCKPTMVLSLALHSGQQLRLVDELLYYLVDDKGGVNWDCHGEGQVIGGSTKQQ